jgi:hypothetical protein
LEAKGYNESRVGQAFVMSFPGPKRGMTNLSEKEMNMRETERIIKRIMEQTGKTREEAEAMLADPF